MRRIRLVDENGAFLENVIVPDFTNDNMPEVVIFDGRGFVPEISQPLDPAKPWSYREVFTMYAAREEKKE